MIAVVARPGVAHQVEHAQAMAAGLRCHGLHVEPLPPGGQTAADTVVCWGWSVGSEFRERGHDVLVMERGHVGDRRAWTSCGWNGLARRGRYVPARDGGERWRAHWGGLMQPWRHDGAYALLLGQCSGDASLYGLTEGFEAWAQRTTDELRALGHVVLYRPHPLMVRSRDTYCPRGAARSTCPLADDLSAAALAVTYNSTAGIEAVLAGVPTVTLDEGAMAWPVAGHALDEPLLRPDREEWAHNLAWSQFSRDEIAGGLAWEYLREIA